MNIYDRCVAVSEGNPAIVKDNDLCVECGHCLAVCQEEIGVAGRPQTLGAGAEPELSCINCGQCSAACPESAISLRSEIDLVRREIEDPEKIVVFSTSPSVRVGLGDAFLDKAGTWAEGKMVAALKALGADYVFDVTFSADLTIIEEGCELLSRLLTASGPLPQFTSCCPAWVKYVETYHPERIGNLSSAKSPIGMQGATIKTYFASKEGLDPAKIVTVNVTPCTAKKAEIRRPELCDAGNVLGCSDMRDNDYVITTKELAQWMKEEAIDFASLSDAAFDSILGKGSGAGVIFGNTGGVMEAALRMAYQSLTGRPPADDLLDFEPVRGLTGVKRASVHIDGKTINVAVIYGTANAEKFLSGDISDYHFVEVMTCPGGCISGAGQPQMHCIPVVDDIRKSRIGSMYAEDAKMSLRNSIDNPQVARVYRDFYGSPLGTLSEKLLHTTYHKR
ncbi:[FeFe] hydrogenase, group A [Anaerovorax odorimutans]|uniref:[FeFe] hydrogenase, group A n=1 Tax=Anaerovorax odorimutans TaxID=109327 RepID=UPI002ED00614